MNEEDLSRIKEIANDLVMKLHRQLKKSPWAKNLKQEQLYAVFQCYAEDQVYIKEGFEFYEVEFWLDELVKRRKRLQSDNGSRWTFTSREQSVFGGNSIFTPDKMLEDNQNGLECRRLTESWRDN